MRNCKLSRFFLLTLCLLAVSCSKKEQQVTVAPRQFLTEVALLPIQGQSTSPAIFWDLSQELTAHLQTFSLTAPFLLVKQESPFNLPPNAYSSIDSDFAAQFHPAQFVVCAEWIEHRWAPSKNQTFNLKPKGEWQPFVLMMKVRLKVIDIRSETPQTSLQEIVELNCYMEPYETLPPNLQKKWSEPSYLNSPVGQAHLLLAEKIVARISSIIQKTSR